MHDIGNVVNRHDHAQTGAVMAFRILDKMGMEPADVAAVITAIGHHDDPTAFPVNPVAAALILADKTDVRRSRVRNKEHQSFDIHDRVNYAAERSELTLDPERRTLKRIELDDAVRADQTFTVLMGEKVEPRKEFIEKNAKYAVNLDY